MSDHQTNNYVKELTDVLTGDLAQLPQRVQDFREKYKVESAPQEAEPFSFNLATRSYETSPAEAAAAGVNLRKVSFIQGDRFFVARDFDITDQQVWDEVAAPSSVDLQQESSQITYIDCDKKVVDWPLTLHNLNRMIASKPYSEGMMKSYLLHRYG